MEFTRLWPVALCGVFCAVTAAFAEDIPTSNEAINLIGGSSSSLEEAADVDAVGDTEEHPVYKLKPEPFVDESALMVTLDQLLEMALASNFGIQQQHYSVERGHYTVDKTYYAFDPQVGASLSYTHNHPSGSTNSTTGVTIRENVAANISYSVPTEYGDAFQLKYSLGRTAVDPFFEGDSTASYSGGVSLSYSRPLAQGAGRYYNLIPRYIASNNLQLSYNRLDDNIRQLKKNVMDTFFNAVAAREAIQVREKSLDVSLKQLERTVERYKVGLAIRAELLQAENSVLSQRSQLLDAQQNYDSLRDSLAVLISQGREIEITVDSQGALLDLGAQLPDDLWNLVATNSYDLKNLNTQLANLRLQRDQQSHQLKPDLNLGVNYNRSGSDANFGTALTDNDDSSLGLTINWTNTPGNRADRADLAQTELDLASLDLAIQDAELQLKTALRGLQRDLDTKYRQVKLAESNLEVVQETHNVQVERNEVGLATTLDVIEAQENVLTAELALLSAKVAYQQAYREILLLAGLI
ncbi:TolC family protein [bacterium]|nr:TolC family protein [bacterium]